MFVAVAQRVDDFAVEQAEVGPTGWYIDSGKAAQQSVERPRHGLFKPVPAVGLADRVDDVITLSPSVNERGDEFGRVLQVAVH